MRAKGIAGVVLALGASASTVNGGMDIQRLVTLGGTNSQGFGINDNGWVVGQSATANDAALHAVVWVDGVATDLGAVTGNSAAYSINNNNQIVGYSQVTDTVRHAMLWQDGGFTDIGADLPHPFLDSAAYDINDSGLVVGTGPGPSPLGGSAGFVWTGSGGIHHMGGGVQGGSTNYSVNNAGVVVGTGAYYWGEIVVPYLGVPDGHGGYNVSNIVLPPTDTNEDQGWVFAVNNGGVVVGSWASEACIYNLDPQNPVTMLGTLPGSGWSSAADINDHGVIVGLAGDPSFESRAWVYMSGQMIDLNSLLDPNQTEWEVLLSAKEINNNNDIVGVGLTTGGLMAGFVMYNVPAPGAGLVLAAGSLLALRRRRIA